MDCFKDLTNIERETNIANDVQYINRYDLTKFEDEINKALNLKENNLILHEEHNNEDNINMYIGSNFEDLFNNLTPKNSQMTIDLTEDNHSYSMGESYSQSLQFEKEILNNNNVFNSADESVQKLNNVFIENIDILRDKANETKLFNCELCTKKYRSRENLYLHIRNIHLNEKPYKCDYCGLGYSHRNGKTYHERKFHTNHLPYKCNSNLIINFI
jgi:hypothetical protein